MEKHSGKTLPLTTKKERGSKVRGIKPIFLGELDKGESRLLSIRNFASLKPGDHFQIAETPTGIDKNEESPVFLKIEQRGEPIPQTHNCRRFDTGHTEWLPDDIVVIPVVFE